MKHKRFARLLSMLLVVVTMFGVMSLPANAASLNDSGTVTIQQARANARNVSSGL